MRLAVVLAVFAGARAVPIADAGDGLIRRDVTNEKVHSAQMPPAKKPKPDWAKTVPEKKRNATAIAIRKVYARKTKKENFVKTYAHDRLNLLNDLHKMKINPKVRRHASLRMRRRVPMCPSER